MKYSDIFFLTAGADEVEVNHNELVMRLGVDRSYESEFVDECWKKLSVLINYRCSYIRIPVDLSEENVCRFDFAEIDSKSLYKNLKGCREAFVFAVTAGIGVDRYLARLRVLSQAEYFVTDALASAAVDSFCAWAAKKMRAELICNPRFSPGYGDVSLTVQAPLLERLDAGDLLGIKLGSSYLMSPMKSVTAIMGIRYEENN